MGTLVQDLTAHAALFVDCCYTSARTQGDSARFWERFNLDYGRLAEFSFYLAGAIHDEGRYIADIRPTDTPSRRALSPQEDQKLFNRRGFHKALRLRHGYTVAEADPDWNGPADKLTIDTRVVEAALAAQMARVLIDRPDVTHFILLAGAPTYIPMIELAHEHGIYVTLVELTPCHQLERAVDRIKPMSRGQLRRLAEQKETAPESGLNGPR